MHIKTNITAEIHFAVRCGDPGFVELLDEDFH